MKFFNETKIDIMETSAKDGTRVSDAFTHITTKIIEKKYGRNQNSTK